MGTLPDILHVTEDQVRQIISVATSIRLAREAYHRLARDKVVSPERVWLSTSEGTSIFCMPAYMQGRETVAVKIARLNPGNVERSLPSVMATIYVYDSSTGRELARIEAETLTALRTAASSAVATDMLAGEDVRTLGVFGAGKQAEAHIPAIRQVRDVSRVIVYARTRERCISFARKMSETHRVPVRPASSPEEVVESADILVLATNSSVPLFNGESVRPGTHVNAVGAALPNAREMDTRLVKRAVLVVDSRAQAVSSYGDIVIPLGEGAISESDLTELGELLVNPKLLPRRKEDITVFKSGGIAVLDAVVADELVSSLS